MGFDSQSTSSCFVPPCVRRSAGQSWRAVGLEILESAVWSQCGQEFKEGTAFFDCDGDADFVWSVAGDIKRCCNCGVAGCVVESQCNAGCCKGSEPYEER